MPHADSPDSYIDSNSFHLFLFSDEEEAYELWLPSVTEGFFRFSDSPEHRFLYIAGQDGRWLVTCKKPAFFQNVPLDQSYAVPLESEHLLTVSYGDKTYSLYVEKVSSVHMAFHNYAIRSDTDVYIGSHPGNGILYDCPYVSRKHAVIRRSANQWTIHDCGSNYGVYVNGIRKNSAQLQIGEMVCIMGLRIIVGPACLSISDCTGRVTVNPQILSDPIYRHTGYNHYYEQDLADSTDIYFNRMPRKRIEVPHRAIAIEAPPMSTERKQVPMLLRMGSSLVMGGASALSGNYTTLLSSIMFPLLNSKFTENERKEYEKLRLTKYREYLEDKRQEISDACLEQQQLLNEKYPDMSEIVSLVTKKTHLWERRPADSDFLQIRLGTGTVPLHADIEYPARRFELEPDELEEEMYHLVESAHQVEPAPIVMSLADTHVCGLQGKRDQLIPYIRQLVLQITALHSYDEVKTIFLLGEDDLAEMDEIRYLPHAWDDPRTIRLIATDEPAAYKVGEYLKLQIANDQEDSSDLRKILKKRPYYLIFALNKKLFECHEVMKDILQSEECCGTSILAAYDDLPKECQKIISLEADHAVCTTMSADGGEDQTFRIDPCDQSGAVQAMRILANTKLKTVTQAQEMPKMITFLEMFKAGRIEQLNPLKRWRENNPVSSLAAPVGVSADGSNFTLDLHEKRQGPHGLVAGMTGSGKSEFIITYILSMAVNYHPDEVAFVLIDYKGGGLAGAFENPQTGVRLPHLVGTITNLDGASIQRSLMSIESELLRRQRVFNEVKSSVNEGTMDIYAYQKLYRAGKVDKPMPHLFIISDEFAELKQQQPEFMDKLISAARIGRSLGVHLILATQKPSGVVNDQIRSNTKFRVCLRVQDRTDSMDMLKRPEAAELTDTGRFYLQVGYNEYFAMGQSAWCGAPYEPQDTVVERRDDAIEILDITGQVISKNAPKVKKTDSGMKQIVAVVKYLSDLAESQNIHPRQLWQPELPKVLDLDELNRKHHALLENPMSVCLGSLDDPENQQQYPYVLDFESSQNLLIAGDSSSGKTVLVQNILYSLASRLSPENLNFYILDYSSRMLKLFKPLPHCGAVLQEEDSDSLDEFFKLINSIISKRKQLFSKLEVDSFEAARSVNKLPLILVIIDNLAGLSSSKAGEAHSYKLHSYLKDSANYGVKYILTCSHLNEVSSRVRQELGTRICLHMKDKYDYGELLGCNVSYLPSNLPGRGLINQDGRPLEFHSSIIKAGANEKTRTLYLKESIITICHQHGILAEAQHLPVISDTIPYEDFARQFKRGRIPIGYSLPAKKPISLPLKQFSALSLYFGNPAGISAVLENMLYAASRETMTIWFVKRRENSCLDRAFCSSTMLDLLKTAKIYDADNPSIIKLRKDLLEEFSSRKSILDSYCQQQGLSGAPDEILKTVFPYMQQKTIPIMLLIESFADFSDAVDTLSSLMFEKMFRFAQSRNVFVIGCFEPDDSARTQNKLLYRSFNTGGHIILFGGQFSKQELCVIPQRTGVDNILPYNTALMNYQNQLYPIIMPCGELVHEEVDEDEQSIFC